MMPNTIDLLAGRPVMLPDPADLIDPKPPRPSKSTQPDGVVARMVRISRAIMSLVL